MAADGADVRSGRLASKEQATSEPARAQASIARTAELRIRVTDFDRAREAITSVVSTEKGYISKLDIWAPPSAGRTLNGVLQVPAQRLDATLTELGKLGRVESESQSGEDVGRQMVDVEARLSNLRAEEGRLNQMMRERTGKLSDLLMVEERISSVRGQIESSQAEQKNLAGRVAYASLRISLIEEYTKTLTTPATLPALHILRNASVEGFDRLWGLCLGTLVALLTNGPVLLLLCVVGTGVYKLIGWLRIRRGNIG